MTRIHPKLANVAAGFQNPSAETRAEAGSWFVYLLALTDCSAFKVGFTCNPLQRICAFSRRYFERFDLDRSVFLRVCDCEAAREIEAALKTRFADVRADAPAWIAREAGGETEWFSAVYLREAEERLRALLECPDRASIVEPYPFLRDQLLICSASFEQWAWSCAHRVSDAAAYASRGYAVHEDGRSLRDWLDAYRYFDIELFRDDPAAREFVSRSAGARP